MKLDLLKEASKTVPIYIRKEEEDTTLPRVQRGCFECNHAASLGGTSAYVNIAINDVDAVTPLLHFLVGLQDRATGELMHADRHWLSFLRYCVGYDGTWRNMGQIGRNPDLFVRMTVEYGEGRPQVTHSHRRINVAELMRPFADARPNGSDFYVSVFNPTTTYNGVYIDPLGWSNDVMRWGADLLYENIRATTQARATRFMNGFWPRAVNGNENRLTPLHPDGEEGNEQGVTRRRATTRPVRDPILTQEMLDRMERRIINAGAGRRPTNEDNPPRGRIRWEPGPAMPTQRVEPEPGYYAQEYPEDEDF